MTSPGPREPGYDPHCVGCIHYTNGTPPVCEACRFEPRHNPMGITYPMFTKLVPVEGMGFLVTDAD